MNFVQQPIPCVNPYLGIPNLVFAPAMQPGVGAPFPPQGTFHPEPGFQMPGAAPVFEQSYIENILRLNRGKVATVYMSFEGSQWGSKIFKGIVLAAGRDHLILKDLQSEVRYVLLTVYLNYFTFDEEIDYQYPVRKKKNNPEE